jgi:ATP-dependent RNA helicase DDX52/ROK1
MTGSSKRKSSGSDGGAHAKRKRHKAEELVDGRSADVEDDDESNGSSDLTAERDTNFRMPKQRVTTKGNNVPERVDTFEELRDRYRMHSQLMDNLKRNGYEHPTGIQSAGCPILLEVRGPIVLSGIALIVEVSRFGRYIPYGHRKDIILSLTRHVFAQGSDLELYGQH